MTKEFFLGALVAIALLLLWRKEHMQMTLPGAGAPTQPGMGGGCPGCAAKVAGFIPPDAYVSPADQGTMGTTSLGLSSRGPGTISPSGPPLGGTGVVSKDSSFYGGVPVFRGGGDLPILALPTSYSPAASAPLVPGSPTTPTGTAIRAVTPVPSYADQGFVAGYRALGSGVGSRKAALL